MLSNDKFIAFVDIVGFTAMVEAAEVSGGDYSRPIDLAATLGSAADSEKFKSHGPTTCPHSRYIIRDLDFQVTQISDCVIISAEVSPAGVINLVSHCFSLAGKMLLKNALCRGYITRGKVHHQPGQVIGTGYMHAYRSEGNVNFLQTSKAETGTPFIQIDESVLSYVRDETDECVQKMFERVTLTDGTYTAIYPFKALARVPSTVIGADFNPVAFQASIRRSIGYREADLAAFKAIKNAAPSEKDKVKIEHYMRGLEEVIGSLRSKEVLVQKIISNGCIPYGMIIA